ncbi:hypothetical protein [Microvirga puerhi]|uniref:HEPN domain-containing protein n=1 Tax=Microvirga puerhi TaxID=2876078 RepID=A0ABS7VSH5_9HYPH|nr:hypothetical protein [Microvirga puerhi]MBZ6078106.1 hypothetical protein [Microvirga puerhi]
MPISDEAEMEHYEAFMRNAGSRLISPASDDTSNIEFKFGGDWRECRIWEGYFDASLILLRTMFQKAPQTGNLIFPALFNLRHATEVALKWHIRYAGGVVPKRVGHNLDVLIEAFRETAYDLDNNASYISDNMLNNISEFALVDPRSVTFRYSTELDGSHIKIAPERWDLGRLYFVADALSLWFDGLSGAIDLSRDDEYQAYLRGS